MANWKRVTIDLMIDMEKYKFIGNDASAQIEAFKSALGRMAAYAIGYGGDKHDVKADGNISIGKDMSDAEIVLTYKLWNRDKEVIHRFTMGAVSRDNGTEYTFHS